MCYQNIGSMFFRFVTKHECDRRTDRQNHDPKDCVSIAALSGKNTKPNPNPLLKATVVKSFTRC